MPKECSVKHAAAGAAPGSGSRAFLRALFSVARSAPWALDLIRPVAVWGTFLASVRVRRAVRGNSRNIFGVRSRRAEMRFVRSVIRHFFDFVADVGQSQRLSAEELRAKIERVDGRDEYLRQRPRHRGVIILTAHLGSFEIGLAALAEVEPVIHVVFKRDALDGFELIRKGLRERLGIREAPIDDGWDTWIGLRDALKADEVVVLQGDRAMAGQKAEAVPFFKGRLRLPTGPVRLAQLTGSPIVPVFVVRTNGGRCRLSVEEPIYVDVNEPRIDGIDPALLRIGKVMEKYIGAYPEQWLILDSAFVEDNG